MADLAKLREKTKNMSILYVEDSAVLQNKMQLFLGKLFKNVYIAEDGVLGVESFKEHRPTIVLTDIDMPNMDGHGLVEEILKIDPKAKIIVYSAYANSENLLKSIHLGVVDFIPKPVDLELFDKTLSKVVNAIELEKTSTVNNQTTVQTTTTSTTDVQEPSVEERQEIFKQLEIIKKSHHTIEFVNHYRGVPIYDHGTISLMDGTSITVQVPFLQAKIMKLEKLTVMISELFEHTIIADLEKINSFNNSLVLTNLQYLKDKEKRKKSIAVEPNGDFGCNVKFKNSLLKTTIKKASVEYIILDIEPNEEEPLEITEGDELDLQLLIQKEIDKTHCVTITLDLKGELYLKEEIEDQKLEVMILLEIDQKQKELLDEYITARRKELIVELKQMKD